ncbi:MAG: glycoside hydrolase family 3 N-terminal domain-containing protein [Fulvivirga sp.]|uniref:glycoside hydrolase family 3 protein n=1 Tax=Fulvivirga sp. TaxID=1931237 RepID=UPI0032ECD1F0
MKGILSGLLMLVVSLSSAQKFDSLDFKIGQMLIVGVSGTSISDNPSVIVDIEKGRVGGVILFEKNISASNSFVNLKKFTSNLGGNAPVPLFIAIDQEGGLVNRLKEKYSFPKSVTAEYLGNTGNPDSTKFYAEITAATLAGLGINVNFAPVVDIRIDGNPVIAKNGRAYSKNPDSVALHAQEVVNAMREFGIISVLKHFPGHGSSMADSHYGVTDVTNFWSKEELVPYIRLINSNQVDAVMSAHIVNKKLDKEGLPSTLSTKMINGLLRKDLNYHGVVFSDDMQMHAITKYYGLEKALKLSILAGVDVLMFSNNIQGSENRTVDTVHNLIKKMVKNGVISEERINESYHRIVKLKMKYNG